MGVCYRYECEVSTEGSERGVQAVSAVAGLAAEKTRTATTGVETSHPSQTRSKRAGGLAFAGIPGIDTFLNCRSQEIAKKFRIEIDMNQRA
jgi:hypothetical protein